MATLNSDSVKIVEICRVFPQPSSPDSPIPDHFPLPLTFFDIFWIKFKPVQRIFFYETSSTDTIIPKLKTSLSLTLQHFLPLVGTLTWPQDSYKPILNYFQGDTISLTIAESEADFHHLSSNQYIQAKEYHPLVPQLAVTSERAAVSALQITVFPNRGFSFGICMHHAVVDGKSAIMFLKSWAHICKHGSTVPLPDQLKPTYNERQAIKDPKGLETIWSNDWLRVGGSNSRSLLFLERKFSPGTIRGTFEFTRANIQKLRGLVKTAMDSDSAHLSSFSLTCGYTWACLVKAENIESEQVGILISVDWRSRLDPPLSASYFGNCITGCPVFTETKGLLGEDGVLVAVNAISESIKDLNVSKELFIGAETWVSKYSGQTAPGSDRMFSVAGSARFEIYDTDFGWGSRPRRNEIVSIDITGAISFSDSKNGGGGVEVGVVLDEPNMEVFASLFAEGLN